MWLDAIKAESATYNEYKCWAVRASLNRDATVKELDLAPRQVVHVGGPQPKAVPKYVKLFAFVEMTTVVQVVGDAMKPEDKALLCVECVDKRR